MVKSGAVSSADSPMMTIPSSAADPLQCVTSHGTRIHLRAFQIVRRSLRRNGTATAGGMTARLVSIIGDHRGTGCRRRETDHTCFRRYWSLRTTTASGAAISRDRTDSVVDSVLSASRVLVAVAARSLADFAEEVTLTQYRTLVVLASRGPQNVAGLAEAVGVTPATATRMCDRLVKKKLIARRSERGDRRQVRLVRRNRARPGER